VIFSKAAATSEVIWGQAVERLGFDNVEASRFEIGRPSFSQGNMSPGSARARARMEGLETPGLRLAGSTSMGPGRALVLGASVLDRAMPTDLSRSISR
jgi:hypothetical protein